MRVRECAKRMESKFYKKVYSNYLLELYEDVLDLNGKEKTYLRGFRKDYSTVVPFVSKDEILVIESYRHLVDSTQIEVPFRIYRRRRISKNGR